MSWLLCKLKVCHFMPCSKYCKKKLHPLYREVLALHIWKYYHNAAMNINLQQGIKIKRYKVTKLENKLYRLKLLFVVALSCRLNAFFVVVTSPLNTYIFLGFLSGFGIFFRDKIKRMVSWSLKRCSCLPFFWSVCFIRAGMASSTLKRNTHVSFKCE